MGRICWAPKSRARKNDGPLAASWNREGGPIDSMTADLHTSSKNPEKPYGFHTFLKDPRGGKKNGNKKVVRFCHENLQKSDTS